jgi:hypothetical protein
MLMTPVDVISLVGGVAVKTLSPRPGLVSKKNLGLPITSNVLTHEWSTKYRRKKLITLFGRKSRDESFKPN